MKFKNNLISPVYSNPNAVKYDFKDERRRHRKSKISSDEFDKVSADEFVYGRTKNQRKAKRRAKKKAARIAKRKALHQDRVKYDAYMRSQEWAAFRITIFAERGRRCERCGTRNGVMHLHHLTYARFTHELPQDVQIVCVPCHESIHGKTI